MNATIDNNKIEYKNIDEYLYWVDDINSKYYNQLVDSRNINKDWKSAEHLIEYPNEYEYVIEIKSMKKAKEVLCFYIVVIARQLLAVWQ